MDWSPQQVDALKKASAWFRDTSGHQVFRVFGYAGTGKTTLAKHLAAEIGGKVIFAAYTGKAAHVLTRKGCPAQTIHSLIYRSREKGKGRLLHLERELMERIAKLREEGMEDWMIEEDRDIHFLREEISKENKDLNQPRFVLNEASEIRNANLVVIDECSMVDDRMGEDLLSFGVPVMVLGDPAQLPPVGGAGYFTEHVKPDVMLTEIHRQAQESGIIQLATMFREGKKPTEGDYGEDCKVLHIDHINTELVRSMDQVIVGRNVTRSSYNKRLRMIHGMQDRDNYSVYPVERDRVICLRNNPELGLLNGAMFNVSRVGGVMDGRLWMELTNADDQHSVPIEVSAHTHYFEGGNKDDLPFYERKEAEEFDYGYAITCHKSQGSQWDDVMVFDESWCFRKDWHRWAYTAATRAAETLHWVKMR